MTGEHGLQPRSLCPPASALSDALLCGTSPSSLPSRPRAFRAQVPPAAYLDASQFSSAPPEKQSFLFTARGLFQNVGSLGSRPAHSVSHAVGP